MPLAVRVAVAEALFPGELHRLMGQVEPLVGRLLSRGLRRWVRLLGPDDALQEARVGALRGVASWLLRNGPCDPCVPPVGVYVTRNVRFHFGSTLAWFAGPFRLTNKVFARTAESFPLPAVLRERDDCPDLFATPDPLERVIEAEATAARVWNVLRTADWIDPSGRARRLLVGRFGLAGGEPMTFAQIAAAEGIHVDTATKSVTRMLRRLSYLHAPGYYHATA